ncbi:MAG: KEOPS complex subunit Pcc1 [Sulfolobales archaeon]
MVYKVFITLSDLDEDLLDSIYSALKPEEMFSIRGVRTTLVRTQNPSKLVISIEAQTLSSLKATFNSTIRLIKLVVDVVGSLR